MRRFSADAWRRFAIKRYGERDPSFTDYLIPAILDMPPVRLDVLELADPHAPYGLRGVGEPPTISSTPAVVAAIRAATGRDLTRAPVRPEHITGA
jgi:CO/xanthine dehydrogenase Mo-binding subunit